MKQLALISIIILSVAACTKGSMQGTSKTSLMSYDSPIQYQRSEIKDKAQAAMVDGQPVSWDQLRSQDAALVELQKKYDDLGLGFAYAWAVSLQKEGEPLEITVFMAATDEKLEDRLKMSTVEIKEDITVKFEHPSDPALLAQANGKNITWAQFQSSNVQNSKLYAKLFQQRMRRLNGIVIRRFLLQASKAENIRMEEFVKSKIIQENIEPTEADVRVFAQEKGIQDSALNEDLLKRLKEIVRQNRRDKKIEAYVAKNLIKTPIQVGFDEPKMTVKTPELTDAMPQWGGRGPELVFVGHWDCDDCVPTLKSFLQTKDNLSEKVTGAFIYSFPERNRASRMGAEAALCVKAQKDESFWLFVNKVMEIQEENLEEKINLAAQGSGVDYDQFRNCFLKREFQQVVDAHLVYAKSLGVTTAPLMILQGKVLELPVDMQAIQVKLKELGVKTAGAKKGLWTRIKAFFGF